MQSLEFPRIRSRQKKMKTQQNRQSFYTERCEAMRNFANKIWNASRFLMMNLTIEDNALP